MNYISKRLEKALEAVKVGLPIGRRRRPRCSSI